MAATKPTQIQIRPSALLGCVTIVPCIGQRAVISYTVPTALVDTHGVVTRARLPGCRWCTAPTRHGTRPLDRACPVTTMYLTGGTQ